MRLGGRRSSFEMLLDQPESTEAGKWSWRIIKKIVTMVMSFGSDLSARLGSFLVSLVIMTKSAQKKQKKRREKKKRQRISND